MSEDTRIDITARESLALIQMPTTLVERLTPLARELINDHGTKGLRAFASVARDAATVERSIAEGHRWAQKNAEREMGIVEIHDATEVESHVHDELVAMRSENDELREKVERLDRMVKMLTERRAETAMAVDAKGTGR